MRSSRRQKTSVTCSKAAGTKALSGPSGGGAMGGAATAAALPTYEVREVDGEIEVRVGAARDGS